MKRLLFACCLMLCVGRNVSAQTETVEFYAHDAIGSIRIVFAANGTVLGRQDYAPFGRALFAEPSNPKESFGTQESDGETTQMYFHARMFQPTHGRFASPDPVPGEMADPQTFGRYSYARNNPVVYQDFSGLWPVPTLPCVWCMDPNRSTTVRGDSGRSYESAWTDGIVPGGRGGGRNAGAGGSRGGRSGNNESNANNTGDNETPDADPPKTPPTPAPPKPECDPVKGDCGPSVAMAMLKGFLAGLTETCPGLLVSYAQGAIDQVSPLSPSPTDVVPIVGQFAQQAQMNRALAYAASRPNVIGGRGLLMPFRSSTFRGMFATFQSIGSKWVPAGTAAGAAIGGIYQVYQDAQAGKCK